MFPFILEHQAVLGGFIQFIVKDIETVLDLLQTQGVLRVLSFSFTLRLVVLLVDLV